MLWFLIVLDGNTIWGKPAARHEDPFFLVRVAEIQYFEFGLSPVLHDFGPAFELVNDPCLFDAFLNQVFLNELLVILDRPVYSLNFLSEDVVSQSHLWLSIRSEFLNWDIIVELFIITKEYLLVTQSIRLGLNSNVLKFDIKLLWTWFLTRLQSPPRTSTLSTRPPCLKSTWNLSAISPSKGLSPGFIQGCSYLFWPRPG